MWVQVVGLVVQVVPAFIVSTWGRLSRLRTCRRLALVLWWRVPCFRPLSRFALGALLANMALFRVFRAFLARFGRFVWVYVVLVRCVACGAFVRVWS